MTHLIEKTIGEFREYTEFVHMTYNAANSILWYRGSGKYGWGLRPSLYRHTISDIVELLQLENQLMNRFHQRGYTFLQRQLDKPWELLFFMQHYGVPTRLLDWSESPFVALYFALTAAPLETCGGITDYTDDVAVWVLNPIVWNRHLFPHLGDDIDILSPLNKRQLEGYEPKENPRNDLSLINEAPIALYGTHNSQRIVAQRGVFTIFGKDTRSMEEIYQSQHFPNDVLFKLRIDKSKIKDFLQELLSIGLTDSVVYPDLFGLSMELKRFFKF